MTKEMTVLHEDRSKRPNDETNSELPEVELGETDVTDMKLVKKPGLHSGGTISWHTEWGDNLHTSTTELVIMLTNATVKYTMEWTLLIITEAHIDMVVIKPSKQQVIKGNGSKKLTYSNERLVRELEPRKTRLEAQPTTSDMTPPTVLVMKTRKVNTPFTTVTQKSSTASPNISPQPTSPTQSWPVLSTESPVFGEFVRNNLEEEMYDSLLLYATEECSLVKDYMGEERTGRYVPMLSRWGDAANPPQEDVQHVRQGLPGGCV